MKKNMTVQEVADVLDHSLLRPDLNMEDFLKDCEVAKEYSCVMDNLDLLEKAGYKVDDFGAPTVRVTECPVELTGEDVSSLVLEFADQLTRMSAEPEPVKLSWLYNSTACRAAVKAGDRLSAPEMEELVNTVLTDDDVRYCPHGRPVMFELGENELKKLFGRDG